MPAPTVEMGLGGSFFAAVRSEPTYRFWQMRRRTEVGASDSIACEYPSRIQFDSVASIGTSPPTPSVYRDTAYQFWYGETLDHNGGLDAANYNLAGTIPDGCRAFKLDGVDDYFRTGVLGQLFPPSASGGETWPFSIEIVLTINALPSAGQEPAIWGGDSEYALTYKDDGKVYAYYDGVSVANASVTVGSLAHIVYTRTAASPNDTVTLWVNGVSTSATPAKNLSAGAARPYYGKHWTNAHYLNATYQVIAHYPVALDSTSVAAHYAALQWTDVTADTKGAAPLVIERGIRDDAPASRVASTGTLSFSMNNLASNSGGATGYYSPGHASCRAGFAKGAPVRVKSGSDAIFLGRVTAIAPTPGRTGGNLTKVVATDFMDRCATFLLEQVPVMEDITGDQAIAGVIALMLTQPNGLITFQGSETYTLALDNTRDESVSVLSEMHRLAMSELGYVYVLGDGRLVYEARSTRISNEPTPTVTLSDTMHGLDVAEVSSSALNRVQVTVHPRVLDAAATTVLYELVNPLQIAAGETKVVVGPFRAATATGITTRVGGLNMVDPVATTDYTMNTASDDTGTVLTSSLGVVVNYGPNGVKLTLTNNATDSAYITKMQCRGKGVYDFRTVVLRAQNDSAVASDGVNALNVDMVYQEDASVGQSMADALLSGYGDLSGTRVRQVSMLPDAAGMPAGLWTKDISDRVAVSETVTGATGEYYINGVKHEYQNGTLPRITWWLSPAEPVSYWVLDTSTLGDNTMLGV